MKNSVQSSGTTSVSVVIPTLGGESLAKTIEQLNCGTLVPSKIFVCIPEEDSFRIRNLSFQNVTIIKTGCRGQVAQRAIGFQQTQQPMILQLDDDILLGEKTLQELVTALRWLGPGNALAPVYYDAATGCCIHELGSGLSGWIRNLYTYTVCGAPWGARRMGAMTRIGLNYGVDSSHCDLNPFETQWLPGGCVLCFREDIILGNFFPYAGKAYCEDLIHSYLRTMNGVQHWVIPNARCSMDTQEPETDWPSIQAQNAARLYFVKLSGGAEWQLALYNILSVVRRTMSNKIKRMKN